MENFGTRDLFLVDAETGNIGYSVTKAVDFGTSLLTGPYANTNIAGVYKQAVAAKQEGTTFFADFKPYPPLYNKPAAFIAAPVFEKEKILCAIIFQVSIEGINNIMTNNHKWQSMGLGKTGENLLIGPDMKFRSSSRHFAQAPELLAKQLLAAGVDQVNRQQSAIGILPYDSPVVHAALQGEEGVGVTTDYRGVQVIAGYAPLDTLATRWAVVTTIGEAEAFESFYDLRNAMMVLGVTGGSGVLGIGILFARTVIRPLNQMISILSSSSAQITTSVTEQEAVIRQQASAVQQTNTTVEELNYSSKLSAQQVESAASGAQKAPDLSEAPSLNGL